MLLELTQTPPRWIILTLIQKHLKALQNVTQRISATKEAEGIYFWKSGFFPVCRCGPLKELPQLVHESRFPSERERAPSGRMPPGCAGGVESAALARRVPRAAPRMEASLLLTTAPQAPRHGGRSAGEACGSPSPPAVRADASAELSPRRGRPSSAAGPPGRPHLPRLQMGGSRCPFSIPSLAGEGPRSRESSARTTAGLRRRVFQRTRMNSEMKGDTGRGLGGTRGQQQLERATALRHMPVSPKPQALCTLRFAGFYGGRLARHEDSLTPLLQNGECGPTAPSLSSRLRPSGDQSPSGSHQEPPHRNQRRSSDPVNAKGFGSSVPGTGPDRHTHVRFL